jgi:hypothetical protein
MKVAADLNNAYTSPGLDESVAEDADMCPV